MRYIMPLSLRCALLILVTLAAYTPVVNNGYIWDDDYYVTENQTLRDGEGLLRIWTELGAVPQYYPLTHTTFWIEYQLWDLRPAGYHVVNVLLHALAAVLWMLVLERIGLRPTVATLAAALFALHPVHVESVAWITERKNVLSAVFYLGSALCYFRRSPVAALLLFAAALLSKTTAVTLPCALLLVTWMRDGRWSKRELLTLPMFAIGIAMGLLTVYMERTHVGAAGEEWSLSIAERFIVAGRALWFYAGKLIWPQPLVFFYPRWNIDGSQIWQYGFPVAAIAVIALLAWRGRRKTLVGVLFFAGTLFPALGFFDVFPFRYSFVADHFQYMASMGVLALAAAALVRVKPAAIIVLIVLGVLTFRQTFIYRDAETLWRHTIAHNDRAWMAHNNLGVLLDERGDYAAAIDQFEKSVAIKPDHYDAMHNKGLSLQSLGRDDEAIAMFETVLAHRPNAARTLNALAHARMQRGETDAALALYQRVIETRPASRDDLLEALFNSGILLQRMERLDDAQRALRAAVQLAPDDVAARRALGAVLAQRGDVAGAAEQFAAAVDLDSEHAATWANLGVAQLKLGQNEAGIASLKQALAIEPDRPETAATLAWVLATHPDDTLRDRDEARRLIERVIEQHGETSRRREILEATKRE